MYGGGGGGGGQWPGQQQQQQQQQGYMQPQQTGYMGMQQQRPMMTGLPPQQQQGGYLNPQATGMMNMGMGMQPQATGMSGGSMGMGMNLGGLGGLRQPSYGQPGSMMGGQQQQRYLSPNPMQMQPTGMMQSTSPRPPMGLQPQATGYLSGPMQMQSTGLMPQQTGMMMPQMTGMPMDPRLQLMSMQFLPAAQPFSGAPSANNMNFSSGHMQPSSFQSSIQNLSQQQQGSKEPKIPWALSKEERKSYDSVFRAWDAKGSGFISGDVAIEVFGQSGLDRDRLMQIWHLSDTENRGKLNLAEFHVAMGLIYRALNGNDLPEHLPAELVPPSARDLNESVDFLKDLLKRDTNVRNTTGLNLPEAGSNSNTAYGKSRSFHENPIQKQDAAAYKHTDETGSGYKSSSRHLDRKTVRYGGESAADDLSEMKRQLAQTQKMLDSQEEKDDEDREVEKEMDELRFRIKRVQDDIDYYNRRGGRDAAENRRKAERELMHLMHERLPLLEKRLEEKDRKHRDKKAGESRDRDRRNEDFDARRRYRDDRNDYQYSSPSRDRPGDDDNGYNSRSRTPTLSSRSGGDRYDDRRDEDRARDRTPPPAPPPVKEVSKPAPVPPAPPAVAALSAPTPAPSSGPPKNMSAEEKQAWLRSEAQRRIQERMRVLGASAPPSSQTSSTSTTSSQDSTVEQRLAADRVEAEAKAAQADAEASAREEARKARLEEQRIQRERAAVSTIKSELKEQEKSEKPPPAFVLQVAKEEIDEQEEMLKRREEVLKREKEERLARMKRLEEEEEEAKRQEVALKQRQEMFQSKASSAALPAPVRKGKGGPPPAPPSRAKVAPPVSQQAPVPPTIVAPPAVSPVATPTSPPTLSPAVAATPSGGSSTNPFHKKQPNGAPALSPAATANAPVTSPGGTNPFFRSQQDVSSSNLPAPQRSAAASATLPTPAANVPSSRSAAPKVAADDDDWGDDRGNHDDDDDDDNDGPGSTTRATRQNLAQALFSGLVPTPPPSAPAMSPRTPQTPAPPAAPPAPAAPSAPLPSVATPAPGPADRGALLGQIAGGARLRKAQTNDRSAASVSGAVIGDPSPPVQKYIPPSSPPVADSIASQSTEKEEASSSMGNPHRQSVDWAGQLASDQMNGGAKASVLPEEPSVREEAEEDSGDDVEGPEETGRSMITAVNGSAAPSNTDELDEFDLSKTIRVRTLYTYEAQREEDLNFVENSVILAHPAKEANSDWWYGTLITGGNKTKGTFPRAYVASVEQPKIAKALYEFAGSSAEEMNLSADQEVQVVDDEDEHWWKVIQDQERILIVPASYVELVSSVTPAVTSHTPAEASVVSAKESEAIARRVPLSSQLDTKDNKAAHDASEEDEVAVLQRAIDESERDARLHSVARAREEKDYKRALELSKQEGVAGSDTSEAEVDEDADTDSTTGWTSSEDEDESEEEEETEEAKQFRAAERIRVLQAAGILILNDKNGSDIPKMAEEKMLRRKSMKKPRPERPDRVLPKKRTKPDRPDRPAPRLPPKDKKAPEEEMEDAYDRYMTMTKNVQTNAPSAVSVESAATQSIPSSPTPAPAPSLPTAGGGLLNTIKSMSRRGAGSPAERKTTPTISGPMSVRMNSPAIGSPSQPKFDTSSSTGSPSLSDPGATSWSSIIGAQALSDIPEMERKRQEAIFELIKTEGTHVRDLQIIVEVFFNAMQDTTFLSEKARTVIFANVEDVLLAAVTLFSDLEVRQKESRLYVTRIGDILDNHMRQMKVYMPYCVNQSPARHILMSERSRNAQLEKLLVDLRNGHPAARGLDLSSFLLVPMQRLTRYPLLISQIVRYTDGDVDSREMKDLQSAMFSSQHLLDATNEAIRARESYDRLQSISKTLSVDGQVTLDLTKSTRWMGSRSIIRDEVLQKQKSGRKIDIVLCTDLILLLSGNRLYRMPMPLEEIVVRDVPAGLTGRDDLSFQIVHQGREKTNLRCPSARVCHAWMHSIDSARSECLAAANKAFR